MLKVEKKKKARGILKSGAFWCFGTGLAQTLVGRFACYGFVNTDEIGDAVISTARGDLADRSISAAEHFFCLIDACSVEILFEGHARYAAKAP